MFERFSRKSRSEVTTPVDESWPGILDKPEERELADEAVPIPESPHIALLRNSKGGPYYLAPDSAEPLPSGMWAELDPAAVEAETERINKDLELGADSTKRLPQHLRKRLASGGPAAQRLLEVLDRDSQDSAADRRT